MTIIVRAMIVLHQDMKLHYDDETTIKKLSSADATALAGQSLSTRVRLNCHILTILWLLAGAAAAAGA